MTDETTARDRAIEDLARRIESQAVISTRPGQLDELEQIAHQLRALAGALTADVAAFHGVAPEPPAGSEHYREGWRNGYEQRGIDAARAAAPEGAPTANVAEGRRALYTKLCPAHGATACPWCHDVPDLHDAIQRAGEFVTAWGERADEQDEVAEAVYHDGQGGWTGTLYGADLRAILDALAAAPEGAPTADLSCRFCSNNVEVISDEDSPGCGDIECVQCAARWDGKTGALMWSNVAPLAAAPEGMEAAEELCGRCAQRIRLVNGQWESEPDYGAACPLGGAHEPDGMDLEAQGEMAEYGIKDPAELLRRYKLMWAAAADELAAAQAAIQRGRGLLHERRKYSPTVQIHDVLRTLDGDTTEEAS